MSLRPSHRRVSTCRLQNGQGQASTLSGLARGVDMESDGHSLVNLRARYLIFYSVARSLHRLHHLHQLLAVLSVSEEDILL
jgi:hypothetical protein